MSNATAIQKIKTLKSDAAKIGNFHETFATQYADKKYYDKQGFGFNLHGNYTQAFSINVSFSAYCGSYGSSSVYSSLSVQDGKAVSEALVKALNKHQKLIFQTMSEIMLAEATKLRDEAQKEISAMQSMLHDLDTPQTHEPVAA